MKNVIGIVTLLICAANAFAEIPADKTEEYGGLKTSIWDLSQEKPADFRLVRGQGEGESYSFSSITYASSTGRAAQILFEQMKNPTKMTTRHITDCSPNLRRTQIDKLGNALDCTKWILDKTGEVSYMCSFTTIDFDTGNFVDWNSK